MRRELRADRRRALQGLLALVLGGVAGCSGGGGHSRNEAAPADSSSAASMGAQDATFLRAAAAERERQMAALLRRAATAAQGGTETALVDACAALHDEHVTRLGAPAPAPAGTATTDTTTTGMTPPARTAPSGAAGPPLSGAERELANAHRADCPAATPELAAMLASMAAAADVQALALATERA